MTRRVVGAIVLGLLGVIILPQLLSGSGRIPESPQRDIPAMFAAPDASKLTVDLPLNARAENNVIQPDVNAASAVVEAPSIESSESMVGVWSLQIASFKDSVNAAALRDGLRDAGFRSYNKENVLSDGGILTQVMVGPVHSYDEIQSLKSELSATLETLKISGPPLVVKYIP